MRTTLMLYDFDFIVATVNDASMEIVDKQEVKREQMYNHINIELQGVQQALQSSCAVPTALMTAGTVEPRDEPAQLPRIVDMVKAHLWQAQEETMQDIQALTQVQGVLVKQHNASEWEKFSLKAQWDKEKEEL